MWNKRDRNAVLLGFLIGILIVIIVSTNQYAADIAVQIIKAVFRFLVSVYDFLQKLSL